MILRMLFDIAAGTPLRDALESFFKSLDLPELIRLLKEGDSTSIRGGKSFTIPPLCDLCDDALAMEQGTKNIDRSGPAMDSDGCELLHCLQAY